MKLRAQSRRRVATILLLIVAAVCLTGVSASADTYSFNALPGPGVAHTAPGSTVGWGYSITNNSATNWLVITGLSANSSPIVTVSPYFFDFPTIAPGSSRIVPYNPFSPYGYNFLSQNGFQHPLKNLPFNAVTNPFNALGLYQVTIAPNAPMGTTYSGAFTLSATWFNGNPDTSTSAQFISFAPDGSAPFRSVVTPEPASLTLVGMGLFGLAFGAKKKLKSEKLP